MNQDLNAQAFTHGSDIYFNKGKYDTGSKDGQKLLAHELTHTIQQNGSIQRKWIQRTPDDKKDPKSGIDYAKAKDKNRAFWQGGLRNYNPFNSLQAYPTTTPNKFAHATKKAQQQLIDAKVNEIYKAHGITIAANGIFGNQLLAVFFQLHDGRLKLTNAIGRLSDGRTPQIERFERSHHSHGVAGHFIQQRP